MLINTHWLLHVHTQMRAFELTIKNEKFRTASSGMMSSASSIFLDFRKNDAKLHKLQQNARLGQQDRAEQVNSRGWWDDIGTFTAFSGSLRDIHYVRFQLDMTVCVVGRSTTNIIAWIKQVQHAIHYVLVTAGWRDVTAATPTYYKITSFCLWSI